MKKKIIISCVLVLILIIAIISGYRMIRRGLENTVSRNAFDILTGFMTETMQGDSSETSSMTTDKETGTASSASTGSSSKSTSETGYYADEDFIFSLREGLEKRWSVTEPADSYTVRDDVYKEYLTELVCAEYDILSHYLDERFKDSVLQQKAITYINMLKQQQEAITYMQTDTTKYNDLWDDAYDERCKLLVDFEDNYGLTGDEKFQDEINEFRLNARELVESEEREDAIQDILRSCDFKIIEDSHDGWNTYATIVENTSGINFDYFTIFISLLDEENVVIDSTNAYVETWKVGTKVQFDFIADEDFARITFDEVNWGEE